MRVSLLCCAKSKQDCVNSCPCDAVHCTNNCMDACLLSQYRIHGICLCAWLPGRLGSDRGQEGQVANLHVDLPRIPQHGTGRNQQIPKVSCHCLTAVGATAISSKCRFSARPGEAV
jgi:hypothetical protein